ncbi:MAG: hypothetical protein DRG83_14340, partial [Deltaproteobacteria bacterium]
LYGLTFQSIVNIRPRKGGNEVSLKPSDSFGLMTSTLMRVGVERHLIPTPLGQPGGARGKKNQEASHRKNPCEAF